MRESVELIRAAGARPCGVVIALDRMERGQGELSAVQEVERSFAMPVVSVATLDDLVAYLAARPELTPDLESVQEYRAIYGIAHAPAI